ncbi:MAG: DNA mismatch repair endonuclease MutL [Saprospiraceae bacterium]|jgi:DNA mismatch repair protein MutL
MADIIRLLPDAIANQIAAGEVVQRPSSVVKELLENAVDAGSTAVKIILKDAGRTLIQIVDNGCGMSMTDARMSFERHATSKIRNSEDLFAIRTMGFRGEALASIAAVAQVEMRTRRYADEVGTHILVEASKVQLQEPCQAASGTSIAVKNLFFNVPARRQFLKSDAVELRHILDEFQHIAIANPDVQFSLYHNDNEISHLLPGNLRQRLVGIFGAQYNNRLVPVGEETDVLKVRGFVGKPEFAKKSRGEQLFFVNGRFIKSNYLNHAVINAYESLISKEVFPFYILFIEIAPSNIDVNVHPTKQEIKFEDERLVYNFLRVTVRHALGKYGAMPALDFEQEGLFNLPHFPAPLTGPRVAQAEGSSRQSDAGQWEKTRNGHNRENWEALYAGIGNQELHTLEQQSLTLSGNWGEEDQEGEGALVRGAGQKPVKPPYQLHGAYILSPIKSGFLLIDQQAAHERIAYERYLGEFESGHGVSQRLLFPKTLEYPAQDAIMLEGILPELNKFGFDIQVFGNNTFIVHGVPADLAGQREERQLIEMLIEQYKAGTALKLDLADNLARSMARSTSTRRGQLLTEAEMQSLIDRLFACEMPYMSPFGRKCFLTFSFDELDQQFLK